MSEDDTTTAPTPSANRVESLLGGLKARRQEIVESATIDLPVPRWKDPAIVVRYKPVDHGLIRRAQNLVDKAPKNEKASLEVDVNADVLIAGCVGVFALIDDDETEYSLRPGDPHGDHTRFDPHLAENLGLSDGANARATVRALYMFDGDLIAAAGAVIEFSGYKEAEADERLKGE